MSGLADFLVYLFEQELEEKLWEIWLAKDIDKDFKAFREERLAAVSPQKARQMSKAAEESAIRRAERILGMGVSEDG